MNKLNTNKMHSGISLFSNENNINNSAVAKEDYPGHRKDF